ncbi:MAG: CCA tRNA nucleotidyltransferase [Clostridiales bacterium]|nr:CCA tRNA nucleotidyltransferase [Clostridiales bacterium]
MEISVNLEKLAKQFKKEKLYIVGGWVRDSLLGLEPKDIDITSATSISTVMTICEKLKYKCTIINKKLGTLAISKDGEVYEYTQFRKESYNLSGTHSPDEIEFVKDIESDSLRRDITINAMYYDILTGEIVDPRHGQKDLENKIIRTCNSPNITLKDDGLRILRIIRFASLLNFKISKQTYHYMKVFASHLTLISKERILKEIDALVSSDLVYNNKNQIFLNSLKNLKLVPFIFNSTLTRMKSFDKTDIENFYNLNILSRKIGFYFLIIKNYLKKYTSESQLFYAVNMLLGRDGIKESTSTINLCEKLFTIYQNLNYNHDITNATINYLTLSDSEREIVYTNLNKKSKTILSDNISLVKSHNLPLSVHELDISSQDLIDNKIDRKYISKILSTLYNQVIEMKVKNQKDDLIKLAIDIDKNLKELIKEHL